jgi:hypothetical protein
VQWVRVIGGVGRQLHARRAPKEAVSEERYVPWCARRRLAAAARAEVRVQRDGVGVGCGVVRIAGLQERLELVGPMYLAR